MLTYAGVDLIPAPRDIENWVREHFTPSSLWLPESHYWAGKSIDYLQTVLPPRPRLGTLYWPSGASRWAYGLFLATDKELAQINALVYGNGYTVETLRISDGAGSVEALMYALPARPLSLPSSTLDRLYLLPLVDIRYFLWMKVYGTSEETLDTWEKVFDHLDLQSGGILTHDTIDPDYLTPSLTLVDSDYPLPLALDHISRMIGHRVVAKTNGTLWTLAPRTSLGYLNANLKLNRDLRAGGEAWHANTEKNALVPDTFRMTFPQVSGGAVTATSYDSDITLVSLALPEFQGITGYSGIKLAETSATRASDGSNQAEVDALAEQTATDWYLYSLAPVDALYEGTVPWTLEAHSGAVEWHLSDHDIYTRISRPVPPIDPVLLAASSASPGEGYKKVIVVNQTFEGDVIANGDFTFNGLVIFNDNVDFTNVTIDVINSTFNFDLDTTINIYADTYITNTLIVFDTTLWYVDDSTIDITNSTISFNTNTSLTFETSVNVTFNAGSTLILNNLVEIGKDSSATVTFENNTQVEFKDTTETTFETGTTTTFNTGSNLVLNNLVEVGKDNNATLTVGNSSTVSFGSNTVFNVAGTTTFSNLVFTVDGTSTVAFDSGITFNFAGTENVTGTVSYGDSTVTTTKPPGTFKPPTLNITGGPSWSHIAYNFIVNIVDKVIWLDDGTDFIVFNNSTSKIETSSSTTFNNYALTVGVLIITGTGGNTWTGFANIYPGKKILFINQSSGNETLKHLTGSDSNKQIKTIDGADLIIEPGKTAELYYDDTIGTYIVTGGSALSSSGGSDSDEKVKVSSNDTTAGYLNGKLVAGGGITLTEVDDGSDETLSISTSGSGGTGYWNKITINYDDAEVDVASTTATIELFTLPAKCILYSVFWPETAFAGTIVFADVGYSVLTTELASSVDCNNPSDRPTNDMRDFHLKSMSTNETVYLYLTGSSNLNNLTAGKLAFWYRIETLS